MIDLHNEPSLRKESTRTNLNGAPDCDDASPRKRAPLLKLMDGMPVRTIAARARHKSIATATRH